jgi:hypothetical protein
VAQRLSGENEKINEIERTRVCSPPRATSLKKDTLTTLFIELYDILQSGGHCYQSEKFNEHPGGVAQWTSHPPQEQKTWVRIPRWCKGNAFYRFMITAAGDNSYINEQN